LQGFKKPSLRFSLPCFFAFGEEGEEAREGGLAEQDLSGSAAYSEAFCALCAKRQSRSSSPKAKKRGTPSGHRLIEPSLGVLVLQKTFVFFLRSATRKNQRFFFQTSSATAEDVKKIISLIFIP
jgi:hypothetical protein